MSRPLSISLQKARAVEKERKPSYRRLLRSILSVLLDIEQHLHDELEANKPKDWNVPSNAIHIDPQTQYLEKW